MRSTPRLVDTHGASGPANNRAEIRVSADTALLFPDDRHWPTSATGALFRLESSQSITPGNQRQPSDDLGVDDRCESRPRETLAGKQRFNQAS